MAAERVTFDTKIAVILRANLPVWQKLHITAFLVSGIAATETGVVGADYEDASGNTYLPMFGQPVLVFSGDADQLRTAYERARSRDVRFALFTADLFATGNDRDNRAAVKAVASDDLNIVGLALRADKRAVDKVVKGLSLHQ